MAITNYNFNADSYVKSGSKRIITCSSNAITGNFKYRFYLELVYDSKTYAYTFRPNADGYGIINIGKIIQSIVQPSSVQKVKTIPDADATATTNAMNQSIHNMPHIINASPDRYAYLSTGGSSCKKIELKLYDFYANNSTDTPSRQGSAVTDNLYIIGGYNTSTDLISETYDLYKLTGITKQFISPINAIPKDSTLREFDISVGLSDYGSVSILNRTTDVNTSADTYQFGISYRDSSDTELATQLFENSANYGGSYSGSGVSNDAMIITFGCFPANLNRLPASYERPSDHPTLSYYKVFVQPTGSFDVNARKSALYNFIITDRCQKYDTQRFAYINSFGVWEYITFNKKRTDKLENKRDEIKTSVFDYTRTYSTTTGAYKELPYTPGVAHQSRVITSTNVKSSFSVNTGYLGDYDIKKVREMFLSPNINYINEDGTALAVMLKNSSIDDVVVSHKYEQTEYKLDFEYSVPKYNSIIF